MTREEAIARIEDHKYIHEMSEPRAIRISEALDMAIKALSAEPCEDAISRQEAKKALEDRFMELQKRHSEDRYETNFCLNTILELPSVTPKTKMSFDGMTNGEVIKALFPYIEVETYEYTTSVKWLDCDKDASDPYSYFWSEWWNAPYKVESEEMK